MAQKLHVITLSLNLMFNVGRVGALFSYPTYIFIYCYCLWILRQFLVVNDIDHRLLSPCPNHCLPLPQAQWTAASAGLTARAVESSAWAWTRKCGPAVAAAQSSSPHPPARPTRAPCSCAGPSTHPPPQAALHRPRSGRQDPQPLRCFPCSSSWTRVLILLRWGL